MYTCIYIHTYIFLYTHQISSKSHMDISRVNHFQHLELQLHFKHLWALTSPVRSDMIAVKCLGSENHPRHGQTYGWCMMMSCLKIILSHKFCQNWWQKWGGLCHILVGRSKWSRPWASGPWGQAYSVGSGLASCLPVRNSWLRKSAFVCHLWFAYHCLPCFALPSLPQWCALR